MKVTKGQLSAPVSSTIDTSVQDPFPGGNPNAPVSAAFMMVVVLIVQCGELAVRVQWVSHTDGRTQLPARFWRYALSSPASNAVPNAT